MLKRMITVGIDEVGRGALAGPVVSCAAILKPGFVSDVIVDSKKISPKKRLLNCRILDGQSIRLWYRCGMPIFN